KISRRDSLEIQRRDQCVDTGCPAHQPGQNRAGEPFSVTMSNPRLMNFNEPNSTDDLPLWQMPVTYNQPLSILITSILVELNVVHYLVFDRGLQQLARSFLQQLFEKRFLFIFSSLTERDHFILWHWRIPFFWRPRVRPSGFFLITERMRLFSSPHPQLSVIPRTALIWRLTRGHYPLNSISRTPMRFVSFRCSKSQRTQR